MNPQNNKGSIHYETATPEQKEEIIREAVKGANKDQREMVEKATGTERNIRSHPDKATQEALQKAQDIHDGIATGTMEEKIENLSANKYPLLYEKIVAEMITSGNDIDKLIDLINQEISSAIKKDREELRGKIEGLKDTPERKKPFLGTISKHFAEAWCIAHNSAIEDVLALLADNK
jgi:hypothetical protein